ncbi:MAG: hypothetical protein LAO76_02160 [Acidobacteriia bacterium]|nr:hypothetical protein [Terriglobia bacterium]
MIFGHSRPALKRFELLLFASPEKRCLHVLEQLDEKRLPKRAWIVEFKDYEEPQPRDAAREDIRAQRAYARNRKAIHSWLKKRSIEEKSIPCHLGLLVPFDDSLGPISPFELPLVVDISCAPRGRLLALLEYLSRCQKLFNLRVYLTYTLVRRQVTEEEGYSYGIQDIAVIPGFNGEIRLRRDLLVLVLGFEGNRAFSLYRRLAPNKTFLLLGDSGDEERDFYIKHARENNSGLLRIHGVEARFIPSRDPLAFATGFSKFLTEKIEPIKQHYNVYVSCLGTKLQTLGMYWALRQHGYIQAIDSIPSGRRIATFGRRGTLFIDLGSTGLLDQPSELTISS